MAICLVGPARADRPIEQVSAGHEIAVIGDFGTDAPAADRVAELVRSRNPVAVITVGDNAYDTNDYGRVVGARYCRYLAATPVWAQCPTAEQSSVNRFFPAAGNHDHSDAGIDVFQESFLAVRARTWYAVTREGVEFLVLDSQLALDDAAAMAAQRAWLRERALGSRARWQVVVLHHPPYSSSTGHGSTRAFQWPFRNWGIDLVLAGHDHGYERLSRWGLTYVVNGAGGADLYRLGPRVQGSLVGEDRIHGALFVTPSGDRLQGRFRSTTGEIIDTFTVSSPPPLTGDGFRPNS